MKKFGWIQVVGKIIATKMTSNINNLCNINLVDEVTVLTNTNVFAVQNK